MSRCLDADALLAIGEALDWDVTDGLRHVQECAECRAQIDVLRLTRASLAETESVDPVVLQRVTAAVGVAARAGQSRARTRERWTQSAEAVLAGVTALIVLTSSGIRIESLGTAVLGFTLGVALIMCGRVVERVAKSRAMG